MRSRSRRLEIAAGDAQGPDAIARFFMCQFRRQPDANRISLDGFISEFLAT
jgi:hypothetical protein